MFDVQARRGTPARGGHGAVSNRIAVIRRAPAEAYDWWPIRADALLADKLSSMP
jgi:hypothetical protein